MFCTRSAPSVGYLPDAVVSIYQQLASNHTEPLVSDVVRPRGFGATRHVFPLGACELRSQIFSDVCVDFTKRRFSVRLSGQLVRIQ